VNSRDRVMSALSHQEADRIPFSFGAGKGCRFTNGFYAKLLAHLGLREDARGVALGAAVASDAVLEKLGVDIREAKLQTVRAGAGRRETWEDAHSLYVRDDWGTVSRMPKEHGLCYDMVGFPLSDAREEDDYGYVWPELPKILPESRESAERYQRDGYPVMVCDQFANGFLQTGPHVYGYEKWFMMLAAEEARARRFLDILLEKKMRWWDRVFAVYGDTVDIVGENDDLGTQAGSIVSPDMFRRLILPYHKKLFEHIKKISGAKIFFHSCGAVSAHIGDLIDAGMDILNPVQISAVNMDPYWLKKEFGRSLVFWGGGIDTQYVLPYGTAQEIRDSVERNIDAFAPGGGFVFAPVHNVQADVPVKNFMVMLEAYAKHCHYS